MIPCPGCGAGMRFDIAGQRLKCDYCGETAGIDEVKAGKQARRSDMDLTAFVCPQCAGTIYTTGSEATSFCFFCGASVELEGRMTRAKKPTHIIPFQKTKEECKKIYADLTRKAFFTPGELKDPAFLERFQGIYLPFWNYRFSQVGQVHLTGTREKGDYTEHMSLSCNLNGEYDGISYDASSAFDDELCRCITPYQADALEEFHPAYLSGFYADLADVDSSVYLEDAETEVNRETEKQILSSFSGTHIEWPSDKSRAYHTTFEGASAAMYPVWFLTWRKDNRVAYAVVNGETGKVAADLPIDEKRFFLGTLLLAVPLFLLLATFPVITAELLIVLASILSVVTFAVYYASSKELAARETRKNDKGYQYRLKKVQEDGGMIPPKADYAGRGQVRMGIAPGILPLIGAAAGMIIRILNPVSDFFYYGGTLLILVFAAASLLRLVSRFNELTTRPIPEFHDREGGDENGG